MDFNYTSEEIVKIILSFFYEATVEEEDDNFLFNFKVSRYSQSGFSYKLNRNKLENCISELKLMKSDDSTALYSDNGFEVIISEESRRIPSFMMRGENPFKLADEENKIDYEISKPSYTYLIWYLVCFYNNYYDGRSRVLVNRRFSMRGIEEELKINYNNENFDMLDVIKFVSIIFYTLKINTKKVSSVDYFYNISSSLIFNMAFNFNFSLVLVRHFEELFSDNRVKRMRNTQTEDFVAPKRLYNNDLVNYYLLAVSTENLSVQFLSYYHILEHYFNAVFHDELIEDIKAKISNPGFSYKRKNDIADLVKVVKNRLQIKSGTSSINEREALKIVLSRYVDFQALASNLSTYDPDLIEFYKNNKVDFSNGAQVDLTLKDIDTMTKNLASRIYLTRCALVHSKEGEKEKYTPFKDEKALLMEVPLMRFVAEMVIISNSKDL